MTLKNYSYFCVDRSVRLCCEGCGCFYHQECVTDEPTVIFICQLCSSVTDCLPNISDNDEHNIVGDCVDRVTDRDILLKTLSDRLQPFNLVEDFKYAGELYKAFHYINEFCIPDFASKFPPVVFHWFSGEGPDKESACFFHTGLTNETHIGMSVDLIDSFNSYILTLIHELGHGIRSKIPFKSDKPGGSHGRHWKLCTSMLFKSITLRENHLAKAIGYSLDLLSYKTEIVRARPNF